MFGPGPTGPYGSYAYADVEYWPPFPRSSCKKGYLLPDAPQKTVYQASNDDHGEQWVSRSSICNADWLKHIKAETKWPPFRRRR